MAAGAMWVPAVGSGRWRGQGWIPAVGAAGPGGVAAAAHGARVRQGGSAAWRPLALGTGHGAAGLAAALRGWTAALALPGRWRWRCRGAASADSAGAAQPRAGHGAGVRAGLAGPFPGWRGCARGASLRCRCLPAGRDAADAASGRLGPGRGPQWDAVLRSAAGRGWALGGRLRRAAVPAAR